MAYSRSLHEHGEKAAYGGKATTLGRAKWIALNECVKARGRHSAYKDDCEGIAWVRDGCLILAIENLKVHKWGPPPPDYEPKYGWLRTGSLHSPARIGAEDGLFPARVPRLPKIANRPAA